MHSFKYMLFSDFRQATIEPQALAKSDRRLCEVVCLSGSRIVSPEHNGLLSILVNDARFHHSHIAHS